MPPRKTATAALVLFASLASCQRTSRESSAAPEGSMADAAAPPESPGPQEPASAAADDFDIDSLARGLDPIVRCHGNEVLWGRACASAPDVLAQLASTYPIPAELRECGPSLVACRHARTLCELPNETLVGDSGQNVSVAELAGALYEYGENGLSRKCSIRYPGGCEDLRRYPETFPDCPRER